MREKVSRGDEELFAFFLFILWTEADALLHFAVEQLQAAVVPKNSKFSLWLLPVYVILIVREK